MGTIDLSRSATDFRKHYQSVGMQQGRVTLDADFNENEDLHGEDERRARVDIIGPAGSPDDGFLISDVQVTSGKIDFAIAAGTFYLGGLHLEMDQTERFREQSDWVRFSGPALPAPPSGKRFDLVYLESWLQPVSAVEDSELFEPALGGPDTSARMRVMRRVWLAMNMPAGDCQKDWKTLVDIWKRNGQGTLNDQNELVPDAKLKVEFETGTNPADLCSPSGAGGYLGAENQAIRVQLVDATHFTWGFDNAAPLYRVQVSNNGATITMMTEPRDQAHWPLSGQIVEVIQWTAVLPNNEKLAGQSGFLSRVDSSYNPDTKSFTLTANVPANFGAEWKTRTDAAQLGPEFLYLRVWNRGSDTASPPAIPFVPGTAVSLGQTGLKVTITGAERRFMDYWIIAARPESPNTVVPWLLKTGLSPHGVRRFYAPLAVIEWTVVPDLTFGTVKGKVIHDCRKIFPPLTRLPKCCSYTVGDGVNSFGTFTRVQDAINHLPASGGEICILPGIFEGDTVILNRRNITVHGCGRRTILRSNPGSTNAVIRIQDSQQILIRNLAIEAPTVAGVKMLSTPAAEAKSLGLERIDLADLEISVRNESAIDCRGGRFIRIERNKVQVVGLAEPLSVGSNAGKSAAVFVRADDVRIELNTIEAVVQRRIVTAPGALQIGGGSERVEIRRNRIAGGNGNGITLGSFSYILQKNLQLLFTHYSATILEGIADYPGAALFIDGDDCSHPDPDPPHPVDPEGIPRVPVSDGNLTDIRIIDNDILNMGLNGIATVRFSRAGQGSPISIRNLDIELNRITGCVQVDLGNAPFSENFPYGYGGISLVACEYLTLRNNWITKNGKSFIDPICGVYIFSGGGLLIEQNEIVDNGPIVTAQRGSTAGPRGGIVIELARAPIVLSRVRLGESVSMTFGVPHEGFPALHVSDNVVIAPMGPALQVVALGLVSVQDNQFTSLGVERFEKSTPLPVPPPTGGFLQPVATGTVLPRLAELGGVTIRILNAGLPLDGTFNGFKNMQQVPVVSFPGGHNLVPSTFEGITGGNVLFNDNQVLLSPKGRTDDRLIMSSVLIISADDVSKLGNQSDCGSTTGPIATNGLVMGWSLRVGDNRYKEPMTGQLNNMFSAVTYGLMNTTSVNQGTHCFLVLPSLTGLLVPALDPLTLDVQNRSLVQRFNREICRETLQIAARFEQVPALADEVLRFTLPFINAQNQRQHATLQLEQRRLDAKYGPTSVQVKQGSLALGMHNQFQAGIQVFSERLSVPTPEPSEDRFVVYGRILNDEGGGRAGLSVSLESQDAKVVAKTTTNEKGVFELSVPTTGGSQRGAAGKQTKKRGAADEQLSLRLQVSDRQKKILYRDKEVFQPTSGSLSFQEIVVSEGPEPTKASRKKRSK